MEKNTRIRWNSEWREISLADCEITEIGPGHFMASFQNCNFEVFVLPDGRLSDGHELEGVEIGIESERERIIRERFHSIGPAGTVRTGTHVIKAPMPGLVRSVKVAEGDRVERSTAVLVLEAMKMENSILAGASGRVARIMAKEGVSVEKNAPLLEIELV